jgi:hypothetical protein
MRGERVEKGRTVVLDCAGITLMLTEGKTPPFDLEHLRSQGIEPTTAHIVRVESGIAWRPAFEPFTQQVIEVETPGLYSLHPEDFDCHKDLSTDLPPLTRSGLASVSVTAESRVSMSSTASGTAEDQVAVLIPVVRSWWDNPALAVRRLRNMSHPGAGVPS